MTSKDPWITLNIPKWLPIVSGLSCVVSRRISFFLGHKAFYLSGATHSYVIETAQFIRILGTDHTHTKGQAGLSGSNIKHLGESNESTKGIVVEMVTLPHKCWTNIWTHANIQRTGTNTTSKKCFGAKSVRWNCQSKNSKGFGGPTAWHLSSLNYSNTFD